MDRSKQIVKVSIVGILVNVALVVAKAIIGLATNSIAIVLDAINNLSDALSSIITIIGTKLAGKKPDRKHPFGHGRIEYITSMLIAAMVLLAGVTSAKESIDKILHPAETNYTTVSLVIIVLAVLTKFFLGRYVSAQGKKLNSQALVASGADATFDSVLSLSTLVAAIISLTTGYATEGIFGTIIAVVIIKAGLEILSESLSSIIGARVEPDLADAIKAKVAEHEEVRGVYDLILNRYGPETIIGSVHVEVDDHMTANEIHHLTRHITEEVYVGFGIILTVGIYASNTEDPESAAMLKTLRDILEEFPQVLQMHGFYYDKEDNHATFDLVLDFAEEEPEKTRDAIVAKMSERYPALFFAAILDTDFSDLAAREAEALADEEAEAVAEETKPTGTKEQAGE